MQTPPDLRTAAQKLKGSYRIMERAIREEAFLVASVYAEEISEYVNTLERDVRALTSPEW